MKEFKDMTVEEIANVLRPDFGDVQFVVMKQHVLLNREGISAEELQSCADNWDDSIFCEECPICQEAKRGSVVFTVDGKIIVARRFMSSGKYQYQIGSFGNRFVNGKVVMGLGS